MTSRDAANIAALIAEKRITDDIADLIITKYPTLSLEDTIRVFNKYLTLQTSILKTIEDFRETFN